MSTLQMVYVAILLYMYVSQHNYDNERNVCIWGNYLQKQVFQSMIGWR